APTPGSKSRTGSAGSPAFSATDGDPSAADDSGAAGPSLPFSSSGSGSSGSPPGGQLPMGGPGVNVSLGSKGQRTSSDKADPDDGPRLSEEDSQKDGPRGRSMGPRLWGGRGHGQPSGSSGSSKFASWTTAFSSDRKTS